MHNNLSNIAKAKIQKLEFITNTNSSRFIHCCVLCAKAFEDLDLLIYNTPCCKIATHIDCKHIFEGKCTICDSEFCKLSVNTTKIIRSIKAVKCTIYKFEGVTLHFNKSEFLSYKDTDLLQFKLEHHVTSGCYQKHMNYSKSLKSILEQFENKTDDYK